MSRAAIYARISRDESDGAGVERQEQDCRALAARLGYTVAHVYTDNDIGASTRSTKARPEYAAMIAAARRGEHAAILAYSTSRLTRRPREFEDLLDLIDRHGVAIRTVVSGDVDLSTADGKLVARVLSNFDTAEADRTGERVQRAFLQRAQDGKTHGRMPYGWQRVGEREVLREDQAEVIREGARRLLAGESLRAIALDLQARGVPTPRADGGRWNGTILRQLLLRERNAGLRVHRGEVIGQGVWPAIVSEGDQDRVAALLRDPTRRTSRGTELQHMMSGILRCGVCGGRCRTLTGARFRRADGTEGRRPHAYGCQECFRVRRVAHLVDAVVEAVVLGRLERPDGPRLFAVDEGAVAEARGERDALTARLDLAADEYAEGRITAEQLARITARLRDRIEAAEATMREAGASPTLSEFATVPPAEAWERATAEQRREVVDALMTVTLMPSAAGGRFSPESVRIEWKAAGA